MNPYRTIYKEHQDYVLYHKTYSGAIQEAERYLKSNYKNYYISSDVWFQQVGIGPKKPAEGTTNILNLPIETIEPRDAYLSMAEALAYSNSKKNLRMPSVEELTEFYEQNNPLFKREIYLTYDFKYGNAVDMSNGKSVRVSDYDKHLVKFIKALKKSFTIQVYNRGNDVPNNYELTCGVIG